MLHKTLIGIALASAIAFAPFTTASDPSSYPPVNPQVVIFVAEGTIFGFNFDTDNVKQSELDAFESKVVDFGQKLSENPTWVLRIEGHADETGTESYNMGLTARRIDDLAALLLKGGAKEVQIQRVSYGEVSPLADGHSDIAWATNRRIVARLFITK